MGDEAELVERVRAGDEDAFAAIVRQHHARLLRLAESVVGSRAVADEVVRDTWLAVVRGIERFEGRSSFKTWLFHILLNRAAQRPARSTGTSRCRPTIATTAGSTPWAGGRRRRWPGPTRWMTGSRPSSWPAG